MNDKQTPPKPQDDTPSADVLAAAMQPKPPREPVAPPAFDLAAWDVTTWDD